MSKPVRPLSPHLQVYRPQLTSVLSITHRATGVALSIASLALVYWIWSLAAGPEHYRQAQFMFSTWYGQLVLLAASFSLFYHLGNGIRHLFWDIGQGFELDTVYRSGIAVVVVSVLLTIIVWVVALGGH